MQGINVSRPDKSVRLARAHGELYFSCSPVFYRLKGGCT